MRVSWCSSRTSSMINSRNTTTEHLYSLYSSLLGLRGNREEMEMDGNRGMRVRNLFSATR
jgi:hypothetical protein